MSRFTTTTTTTTTSNASATTTITVASTIAKPYRVDVYGGDRNVLAVDYDMDDNDNYSGRNPENDIMITKRT